MRYAYVGLSTPTAYLYDHKMEFTKRSEWHWTPILESPQGLATLFDRIWFLHPALCPLSMKDLDFVKFLSEDVAMTRIISSVVESSTRGFSSEEGNYLDSVLDPSHPVRADMYNEVVEAVFGVRPGKDNPIDNHSRGFKYSGIELHGNSLTAGALALDLVIARRLGEQFGSGVEFITNRFTHQRLRKPRLATKEAGVVEGVIVKRVPVLQRRDGPEMEGIEDLRDNDYLRGFRKKIRVIVEQGGEERDIVDLVNQVEREYSEYMRSTLMNRLKGARLMNSVSKNAASFVMGQLLPGSPQIASIVSGVRTRSMFWTGFICSLESPMS